MSPSTSSKAFDSSMIDAEAPCELFMKVKPEVGIFVEPSKLVAVERRAALCLNKRFIVPHAEGILFYGATTEDSRHSVAQDMHT